MDEINTIQSLNPWKSLWLKPKQTIRQIVNANPKLHVIPIMFVTGIGYALADLESNSLRTNPILSEIPSILLILGLLILGGISSIIFLYINAWLLKWTGNWLNGRASRQELRSAMAWSSIPNLVQLVIWLPFVFIFGSEVFAIDFISQLTGGSITSASPLVMSITVLATILSIWSMFIFCHMIAEVQGFSAWTAVWNSILSFIPIFLIAVLFGIITAFFI